MIKISGYQIKRELGQGGMAKVYLAIQQSLEREVAIKVLSTELISDQEFCQRFLKEGRILAQVPHPNVVPIFDSGEQDGVFYMCMEFVPGGTLEERLNQGSLSLKESIRILKQIASALEWSHGKGLIHRDVKPANVLFRDDGTPVLSDFGIAKTTHQDATQMTAVGMAIGTPTYMSPEQASAHKITPKSDQYSLGVLFFEMLTGRVPYKADTALAVAIQHLQAPIPTLPGEYEHIQPIIDRVMAKEPEERFNTLEELITTLDKVNAGSFTAQKTEIFTPDQTEKLSAPVPANRNRILSISIGIMGIALVVGGLYIFAGKTQTKVTDLSDATETIPPQVILDPATAEEVAKWLDIADTHYSIGRFVEPVGSNAVEAYSKVLELDATNSIALQGLGNIAAAFEVLARESLELGDKDESKLLVAQGLKADPENPALTQLQNDLDSR
jgi:serine/threonine-protein kinase PpkA